MQDNSNQQRNTGSIQNCLLSYNVVGSSSAAVPPPSMTEDPCLKDGRDGRWGEGEGGGGEQLNDARDTVQ